MNDRVRVTATNGLRLRNSPRDGATIAVLPTGSEVELLGRETWLRVSVGGTIGFVLADFVEPLHGIAAPIADSAEPSKYSGRVKIIDFHPENDVFRGSPLRIDDEFVPSIREIGRVALESGVKVFVTSSLREPKKPVANAIVVPAEYSNHHVGHAIDMNLLVGDRLLTSKELGEFGNLPAEARKFLESIVAQRSSFRWGGMFTNKDPVHIDNGLNVWHEKQYYAKLLTLWGIAPSAVSAPAPVRVSQWDTRYRL